MARKLYRMEIVEYWYEWFQHGQRVVEHQCWYDDRRTITDMRPSMRKQNFYRLTLSDSKDVVVTETTIVTVERY